MIRWLRCGSLRKAFQILLPVFLLVFAPFTRAGETTNGPVVADPPPARLEAETAPDVLRAYLQLQQQLHGAQLAIERNRQEAETAAARNAEAVAARLKALEDLLAAQRVQDRETIDAIQSTNRLLIKIGSACAVAAFLAMLLTAYFQWRAVNRFTEFSVLTQTSLPAPGRAALPPVGEHATHPAPVAVAEQISARLLGALERLERRILELEHTARAPLGRPVPDGDLTSPTGDADQPEDRVRVLLAKGDSLLGLDKIEEALACFDEILTLEADHPEALVKKGDALERLRRIDDAIGCYDRAIAGGRSPTVAYLHKGGLYNRLERYEEALECYEQALRSQERSPAT